MPAAQPETSNHVADSVEDVAELHREHQAAASPLQRAFDAATDALGRPAVALAILAGFAGWMAVVAIVTGGDVHHAAFAWLEFGATLAAVTVALVILVTQRKQDQLAERRARLALELAVLADRKTAKTIELLEEMRRDHPDIRDRVDAQSDEMATPADTRKVMEQVDARIDES